MKLKSRKLWKSDTLMKYGYLYKDYKEGYALYSLVRIGRYLGTALVIGCLSKPTPIQLAFLLFIECMCAAMILSVNPFRKVLEYRIHVVVALTRCASVSLTFFYFADSENAYWLSWAITSMNVVVFLCFLVIACSHLVFTLSRTKVGNQMKTLFSARSNIFSARSNLLSSRWASGLQMRSFRKMDSNELSSRANSINLESDVKSEWSAHYDEESENYYYHNNVTGITQWEPPDEFHIHESPSPWTECIDEESGRVYYYNNETLETRWAEDFDMNN